MKRKSNFLATENHDADDGIADAYEWPLNQGSDDEQKAWLTTIINLSDEVGKGACD